MRAIYQGTGSRLRTVAGMLNESEIKAGVNQGSALSLMPFIIVMKEVTKECRKIRPVNQCMQMNWC